MTKRTKKSSPRKRPFVGQTAMEEAFAAARTAPAEELVKVPPTDAERIKALESKVDILQTLLNEFLPGLVKWTEAVDTNVKTLFENDQKLRAVCETFLHHSHYLALR